MQKNFQLLLGWIVLAVLLSVVSYLKSHNLFAVGLLIAGSLSGVIIPVFLDILLPKIMKADTKINASMASDTLKEGMAVMKQGTIHSSGSVPTPLRSYPLLGAYVLSAFFIITSTGSYLGRGFVLGLGLSLVFDLWLSRRPIEYLKERWFSVFHANLSDKEFDYFVFGSLGIYGILVLLGILV